MRGRFSARAPVTLPGQRVTPALEGLPAFSGVLRAHLGLQLQIEHVQSQSWSSNALIR
jgi:hypothetical protein